MNVAKQYNRIQNACWKFPTQVEFQTLPGGIAYPRRIPKYTRISYPGMKPKNTGELGFAAPNSEKYFESNAGHETTVKLLMVIR